MTDTPEDIPQANQLLYTMKLRNGDEVLFTLIDETDDGLVIEAPIKVSVYSYVENGNMDSNLITQKWIIFSEDEIHFVPHVDIITYSPMAKSAYKLYVNAVNRYQNVEEDDHFVMDPVSTIQ